MHLESCLSVKKYIALPDGFDGHPKNWRVFKGQCETYIQANAMAFQNDDDKKWFLLSHMNKGTALEIVNWIRSDLPGNFNNKSYAQFTSILAGLFEDPTEKQNAMAKLDMLKQGGKGLVEFIAEFDLLVTTAGYKLPDHKEFLCHMFRTKINSRISDQLYSRGIAMDDYTNLKVEALKADASNKARDNERRLQGISVGKGRPFRPHQSPPPRLLKLALAPRSADRDSPWISAKPSRKAYASHATRRDISVATVPRSAGPWCVKCWVKCQRQSVRSCCRSRKRKRRKHRIFGSLSSKGSTG